MTVNVRKVSAGSSFIISSVKSQPLKKKLISSVDYDQSLLVHEPIELLNDIVDKLLPNHKRERLSQYLTSLSTYLKYTFDKHVVMGNDTCSTLGIDYTLERQDSRYDVTADTKSGVTCVPCRFADYVCHTIKHLIRLNMNNIMFECSVSRALDVCDDYNDKFRLFMSHRARCKNQVDAIQSIDDRMKQKLLDSDGKYILGSIIADFKMKFEPMSSRETTLDHYGKR